MDTSCNTFTSSIRHRLVTKVILNSVVTEGSGEKNGKIRSWFDGELALDLDTLRLRDSANQRIDIFYLSTFYGGSDSSWSPTADNYVRFDNFKVSSDSIPVKKGEAGVPPVKHRSRDRAPRRGTLKTSRFYTLLREAYRE